MDPHRYCIDKAAPDGSPGYYAVLFQPPALRAGLVALMALERELQEAVEDCSERAVAEHKLAYWRDELARALDATAEHPVARALSASAAGALDPPLLAALLAGARRRVATSQIRDAAELDRCCAETAGRIGEAMARVVHPRDDAAARTLCAAAAAAERVRLLGLPRRAGLPPHSGVPLDALSGCGATPAQVDRGGEGPELARLRAALLADARRSLAAARERLSTRRGLAATRLEVASAELDALARSGYVERGTARAPLPLTLLWRAWRTRPRGAGG